MTKFKITLLFIFSFFTMGCYADALGNLSSKQLIEMQKNDNALVIDIRTEKEWASTGTIPESHTLQFFSAKGKFDADKWLADLNRLKTSADQPVILVCRSGNRSGMVGNMLTKKLNIKNVFHLSEGIKSWIDKGNNLEKNCLPQLACK